MLMFEQFTEDETEKIEELKRRTSDEHTPRILDDKTIFYRFLKARDFNLKNAEKMIRKHFEDRKLYKTDSILKTYQAPEYLATYVPSSFLGYDKEGSVIRYVDVGNADHRGLTSMFDFYQLTLYISHYMENDFELMTSQSIKRKKSLYQYVVIFNVENLSLFQATYKKTIEYSISGLKLYQDNYPERLKACYVINASNYFPIIFSVLKRFIASTIFQKIHIFGSTGWQEVLLDKIDADELPVFLGGNRTDPDGNPRCNSFITHGRKIPELLYDKKQRKSLKGKADMEELIVPRLSCSEIEVYVTKPTTTIEWEFQIKSGDIAFGLYYKDSKDSENSEELISTQKVENDLSTETGQYLCDKTGLYILLFDNSYSWINSKDIYYRVRTIKPEDR